MGYKHCSRMRRLLGIQEDAYDNLRNHIYDDKPLLSEGQQALTDVVKAYEEANDRVNRNHGTVPIKNEIVELKPMTAPEGLLFYLDSRPNPVLEDDILCHDCQKVLVPKGGHMLDGIMTTTFNHDEGLRHFCHTCKPRTRMRIGSRRR